MDKSKYDYLCPHCNWGFMCDDQVKAWIIAKQELLHTCSKCGGMWYLKAK